MKKSVVVTIAGILAGATLLTSAAPAMAHDHVSFGLSIGVPAPVVVAPAPVYVPPPAPVVYGGYGYYGPVVRVGGPYYYGYGHYYHGYHGYHGWHR